MGCVESRVDNEGKLRACKERKRLMKQLLGFRKEFADSQLAYLRALKNVGVTLRQFTESESLELEENVFDPALPPPPLLPPPPPPSLPLPPSPPPPPNFSPDLRGGRNKEQLRGSLEDIIEIDKDDSHTPPPPPVLGASWEYWDPFGSSLPHCEEKVVSGDQVEDEAWMEANTEFEEEDQSEEIMNARDVVCELPLRKESDGLSDDNLSTSSSHAKDDSDLAMVLRKKNWTLAGIARELDDYFVKVSDGCKEVAVFVDIKTGDNLLYDVKEKSKRTNSAKVFSSLAFSWSSKSLFSTKDGGYTCVSDEPCKPGAHCATLEKLYAAEQKLYTDLKEEEITKLELERKLVVLQKLEEENHERTKTENVRSIVENLESRALFLHESISTTCSTILKLIDEELYPQLIVLTSGLMSIWRKMHENHEVQTHIAQQLSHLDCQPKLEPTTEYNQEATVQLKNEVSSWYSSLSQLKKFQREYVSTLSRWIKLIDSLVDDGQQSIGSSGAHQVSEQWLDALDKLPDQRALDGIKSFLSAIDSLIAQQAEEGRQRRRSEKLERKLQRELNAIAELEQKYPGSFSNQETPTTLDAKHPLSLKQAKIEVLKQQVDDEKAKYANSIHVTRAMILSSLQSNLPNVFRALTECAKVYTRSLEGLLICGKPDEQADAVQGKNHFEIEVQE